MLALRKDLWRECEILGFMLTIYIIGSLIMSRELPLAASGLEKLFMPTIFPQLTLAQKKPI